MQKGCLSADPLVYLDQAWTKWLKPSMMITLFDQQAGYLDAVIEETSRSLCAIGDDVMPPAVPDTSESSQSESGSVFEKVRARNGSRTHRYISVKGACKWNQGNRAFGNVGLL